MPNGYAAPALDRNLSELSNSIGGYECIADTPLLFACLAMTHRMVYFFCAALSLGLVENIGSFTPVSTAFVVYTFTAHETIASQLEDLSGTEDDDLTPNALSNMIEGAVLDILGKPSPLSRAGIRHGVIFD